MSLYDYAYEGLRRVVYEEGATFVPVCEKCGRFMKAHKEIQFNSNGPIPPTADCSKCGPTEMPFEGYIG